MTGAVPLDRDAVTALSHRLLSVIRNHYLERPTSRATAQEVLNALAIATALIVGAARECGAEAEAREFFETALEGQLAESQPTTLGELGRRLR